LNIEKLKTSNGLTVEGAIVCSPKIFNDERGFFYESWNKANFEAAINMKIDFVQDNHCRSCKGVLRGLHYQLPPRVQGKLVRCSQGSIFDVAVDLRKSSPTYGQWGGVKLNDQNKKQIWVPNGFAHGFLTLSDYAEVQYKITDFWSKDLERSIKWNDEKLQINWPVNEIRDEEVMVSPKDKIAPNLMDVELSGDIFE